MSQPETATCKGDQITAGIAVSIILYKTVNLHNGILQIIAKLKDHLILTEWQNGIYHCLQHISHLLQTTFPHC